MRILNINNLYKDIKYIIEFNDLENFNKII